VNLPKRRTKPRPPRVAYLLARCKDTGTVLHKAAVVGFTRTQVQGAVESLIGRMSEAKHGFVIDYGPVENARQRNIKMLAEQIRMARRLIDELKTITYQDMPEGDT